MLDIVNPVAYFKLTASSTTLSVLGVDDSLHATNNIRAINRSFFKPDVLGHKNSTI